MQVSAIPKDGRIGLALSGGGIRAAVFHLGVLRHLAETSSLERVTQISSVSGGSLLIGLVFARAGNRWPSSAQFLHDVYPAVRQTLVSGDLFSLRALGFRGAVRQNVRVLLRRANVLATLLRERWKVDMMLAELPATPVWHVNTTCVETGKNWRFNRDSMGDWRFGRHFSPDVSVAEAIAASAAVPYVIGALKLPIPRHGWWRTDPATKAPLTQISPGHRHVHLWDGGAYENMALEPLYKPMEGLQDCDVLLCSDASAPLGEPRSIASSLLSGRLASPRLFDIASDQIRALRSRMLMKSILQCEIVGFLLRIGTPARSLYPEAATSGRFLSDEDCGTCLEFPTNLTRIAEVDFDRIARHGLEVTLLTISAYSKTAEAEAMPAPKI